MTTEDLLSVPTKVGTPFASSGGNVCLRKAVKKDFFLSRHVRSEGRISWNLSTRLLGSAYRYAVLKPHVVELLLQEDWPFLVPDVLRPEFLERSGTPPASKSGDPLEIYWADLRRLRPTKRQEEFILARGLELLRECLIQLYQRHPSAALRAIYMEHLSPYSDVLEFLRQHPEPCGEQPLRASVRDRAQQRLQELRAITAALVDKNLHLVPALAARYRQVGVSWEDLIQEGNAALLRGVERFKVAEDVRFSHYATWWIQQGIFKALSYQSRTVRLPVYLAQALNRVRNVCAATPENLDIDTLARKANTTPERVERALAADRPCFSLNRPAQPEEDDACFDAALADTRQETDPDAPSSEELHVALMEVLDRLPQREAKVLRMRFGMEDGVPHTLEEVRQELGVSRERVRQLQQQSLQRLTGPTPRKRLQKFL